MRTVDQLPDVSGLAKDPWLASGPPHSGQDQRETMEPSRASRFKPGSRIYPAPDPSGGTCKQGLRQWGGQRGSFPGEPGLQAQKGANSDGSRETTWLDQRGYALRHWKDGYGSCCENRRSRAIPILILRPAAGQRTGSERRRSRTCAEPRMPRRRPVCGPDARQPFGLLLFDRPRSLGL